MAERGKRHGCIDLFLVYQGYSTITDERSATALTAAERGSPVRARERL